MWLEASIWWWGPLIAAGTAWSIWRNLVADREIRRLRERLTALETARAAARRAA
jgi:hypothetical protein